MYSDIVYNEEYSDLEKNLKDKTIEVVINICWGGYSLSEEMIDRLKEVVDDVTLDNILYNKSIKYRSNTELVRIVKEAGNTTDEGTKLKIISIPEDAIDPYVEVYDGMEWVAEGRVWR